ncbi:MAG: hypothetical protein JXR96_22965 [Deltaproteobacteria bacterium]|nr:hypothetical protein [Deltaproteobacteria bacterium]
MPKILVVPDRLLPTESRQTLLSRRSLELRGAETADEALSLAAEWRPALVIFSSLLDEMTVAEFCRGVRALPGLQQTKLLMMTEQLGEPSAELDGVEVDAHLVNPVESDQLFRTLAGLLNVRVRTKPRVKVDLIARLDLLDRDGDDNTEAVVNVLNLSESGLLLGSPVGLPIEALGRVRFFLPGDRQRLTLFCVIRMLANEVLLYYSGEFIGMRPGDKKRLQAFVDQEIECGAREDDDDTGVSG